MNENEKSDGVLSPVKKVIFALVICALFFTAAEIAFRALGLFPPDKPFTVFTDSEGSSRVRYNWAKPEFEFSLEKPEGYYRIMIAGGSTALGVPYHPRSSFGLRLKALLDKALPGAGIELINLGREGIISREVEETVSAALEFHPDLIVVYTGINEFFIFNSTSSVFRVKLRRLALRYGLGELRVAQALSSLATLASMPLRRGEKKDRLFEASRPPLWPVSDSAYRTTLNDFRSNLEQIVHGCQQARVPLVLCTTASNLSGWPPKLQSYPLGFTAETRKAALEAVEQANSLMSRRQYREAAAMLSTARDRFENYAPLSFLLGSAKEHIVVEALQESGPGATVPEEKEKKLLRLQQESLADFKRALSEEVRVRVCGRAPPALNRIIREVAGENGVWLVDTERLFEEASRLAPGFDLFDDQCHPNLQGQQLMAGAIFDLLREHGVPEPAAGWREPPAWDEESFLASREINDKALNYVSLRMSLYLGLSRDLPEKSAALREILGKSRERNPENPYPVILEALVAIYYEDHDAAISLLNTWHPHRASRLERCLDKFFTGAVDLRQGVFMSRLDPAPGKPPLQGPTEMGLFPKPGGISEHTSRPEMTLDFFTSFIDLDAGINITSQIRAKLEQRQSLRNAHPDKQPNKRLVLTDPVKAILLFPGAGVKLELVRERARYLVTGSDAVLSTGPIQINPLNYDLLALQLRREAKSPEAKEAMISWSYIDGSGLPGTARAKIKPVGGKDPDAFRVRLSLLPRWVLAKEVREIIISPGINAGSFELGRTSLVQQPSS
jgi:lysophospholipase L1-like esterase